jgi:hypothetical protein
MGFWADVSELKQEMNRQIKIGRRTGISAAALKEVNDRREAGLEAMERLGYAPNSSRRPKRRAYGVTFLTVGLLSLIFASRASR